MAPPSSPIDMAPRRHITEVFWGLTEGGGTETEPKAVVRQALLALRAIEEGRLLNASTKRPHTLMSALAELSVGDMDYASPELARGETFDERSLVFTIGVLLFERLTARHPFGTTDNPARLARVRRGEMGSGVNFFPSVPKDLRTILMRAMGPFPEERYRTLFEMRTDLARFVGDPSAAGKAAPGEVKPAPDGPAATSRAPRPQRVEFEAEETDAEESATEAWHARPQATSGEVSAEEAAAAVQGSGARPRGDASTAKVQTLVGGAQGKPSRWSRVAPLLHGVIGAVVASVIFLLIGQRSAPPAAPPAAPPVAPVVAKPAEPKPAEPKPAEAPPAPPAPAAAKPAEPKLAEPKPVEPKPAEPKPAEAPPAPAVAQPAVAKPAPTKPTITKLAIAPDEHPAVAAGLRAVEAALPCGLPSGREVLFLGVQARADGLVQRAFLAQGGRITADHVRCVRKRLRRLKLGVTLVADTYAEWRVRIMGTEVEVTLVKPRKLELAP
ncbi:MAG: hypothetical protein IT371_13890 [Deltaproteobacteria bacterium]|nr:hypothetical protein [Deltaproteobacteria bacterium]